jgi:hypothetical protein
MYCTCKHCLEILSVGLMCSGTSRRINCGASPSGLWLVDWKHVTCTCCSCTLEEKNMLYYLKLLNYRISFYQYTRLGVNGYIHNSVSLTLHCVGGVPLIQNIMGNMYPLASIAHSGNEYLCLFQILNLQYAEVYDKAHILHNLSCECLQNTNLLQVQIHRMKQVSIKKKPEIQNWYKDDVYYDGKRHGVPHIHNILSCYENWIISQ